MGRSKYPRELDTSVEIPPVRDNILEVGSDVINSLRSAIFQIERTLGINPQGAVGNTVADRLNKSLDGNGNILAEALDKANVLSGPIVDADVSRVAAIQESKLRLSVPTNVLQTQITTIDNQLDTIIAQLTELATQFAVHVNTNAVNRHPATAISVVGSTAVPSTTAAADLQDGSVQSTFDEIYNAHINFDGTVTSADENSHTANQIYFDNTLIPDFTDASDVQEAIEDVALGTQGSQIQHQDLFHANGILRIGKIDTPDSSEFGPTIAESVEVSFLEGTGGSTGTTTIIFGAAVDTGSFELIPSDVITISDVSDESGLISGSYEIANVNFDVSGDVLSVEVFHVFPQDSTSSTFAALSKNLNAKTNEASLLLVAREEAGLTSAKSIQICNPNAVRVVSTEINANAVTSINRFFNLSIDGGGAIAIDAYDGSAARQTIDSIASRINEQSVEQALPIMAYRLDQEEGGSELVIAHNMPDEAGETHTLKVSATIDDGLTALGFADLEDIEVSSVFGSGYYISGAPYSGLGIKLDTTNLTFFSSTNLITTNTATINFLDLGIKIGDIVTISNAPSDDDNGTYLIVSVTDSQLGLDSDQLPTGFAETSETDTRFRVFNDIVSFTELTFDEVNGTFGAALLDIFMNGSQEVFFKKRLEYEAQISGVDSLITIVDFTGDVAGKQLLITASEGTNGTIISVDSGESLEVYGKDSYVWVTSGEENISLKLFVQDADAVNAKIISDGINLSIDVFGYAGVNEDSNLMLARVAYGNFKGRVIGGSEAPRSISKLPRGTVGIDDIGTSAKHVLLERPLDELRANGVIYGLEVINPVIDVEGFFNFDVTRGVCYVAGKRFEIDARTAIITDIQTPGIDKIFISVDEYGNIVFESALTSCISPFGDGENCPLASLEWSNPDVEAIDLRLLIDELDLKLLNSVTVSPQPKMGHFQTIQKALKYTKRFSELFPKAGTPTIHLKSGTYDIISTYDEARDYATWSADLSGVDPESVNTPFYDGIINSGFFIDFPVNITGEGDSTIIKARSNYSFADPVEYSFRGSIVIPGEGFFSTTVNTISKLTDGVVTISNIKLDNCRVVLADTNVRASATSDPLNFYVDVNNVVFDNRDFAANPFDDGIGPIGIEVADVTGGVGETGNLMIRNCKFVNSNIKVDPNNINNLLVASNILMGDENNALFSDELATGNPFSFTYTPESANVTIVGNIHAANNNTIDSAGFPPMAPTVSGAIFRWGERFSRDVNIGGILDVQESITADTFIYRDTKTFRQLYLWVEGMAPDEMSGPSETAPNSSIVTFFLSNTPGTTYTRCRFDGDDTYIHRVLDRAPIGCNIKSIEVGVGEPTVPPDGYIIEILSRDLATRNKTLHYTSATEFTTGAGAIQRVIFDDIDFELDDDDRIYYMRLQNDITVTKNVYYFKVEYTFNNIEDSIGIY